MEVPSKQNLWEAVVSSEIPRLAQGNLGTRAEFVELYKFLAQGPGDWNLRQHFREQVLGGEPGIESPLYTVSKEDVRYLGIKDGKRYYIPVQIDAYKLPSGEQFLYDAPRYEVEELWAELCNRVDGFLYYAIASRDVQMFSHTIAFFRVMTRLIKPFEDAHTRTLNAWSVLQFKKVGLTLNLPMSGTGFNIPETDTLPMLEMTAIINFIGMERIPLYRLGRYYNLETVAGEEVVQLDERIVEISESEYQELLIAAIRKYIQNPPDSLNQLLHYSGIHLLSWVEEADYPPVVLNK